MPKFYHNELVPKSDILKLFPKNALPEGVRTCSDGVIPLLNRETFFFAVPAIRAQTVKKGAPKINFSSVDPVPGIRGGQYGSEVFFKGGGVGKGNILYCPAAPAEQVRVGFGNAVETFFAVYRPQQNRQTFFPEQVQVPVHRSQGKIGN
jgi:hypothetical protein